MRQLWQSAEFRDRMKATRAGVSAKAKARWADPEYKARVSAAISAGLHRRSNPQGRAVTVDGTAYPSINAAVAATGKTRYAIVKALE